MSRSLKKGPYINPKIYKKVLKAKESGKDTVIKVWDRACVIFPEMVGLKIAVHTGRDFKTIYITESMVGHRLGEFAITRTFKGHAKKGKISKAYAFTGRYLKDE